MAPPAAPRSGLIVNAARNAELAAPAAPVLCNAASLEHRLPLAQGLGCPPARPPAPGRVPRRGWHPREVPPWYPGALPGSSRIMTGSPAPSWLPAGEGERGAGSPHPRCPRGEEGAPALPAPLARTPTPTSPAGPRGSTGCSGTDPPFATRRLSLQPGLRARLPPPQGLGHCRAPPAAGINHRN